MADLMLQLQNASFRGVPFQVNAADVEVGRRVQVHEYPQRDMPYTEDLGRATRAFTVEAFVVGQDYIAQANALIAAAEQEGPGTLVHPWLGSMQVSMKELMRVRFDASLGMAVVAFSFVEGGELAFPSAADSTPKLSQIASDNLSFAGAESFADTFDVTGFPQYVADLAGFNIAKTFGFASTLGGSFPALGGWAKQLGGYATAAQGLLGLPSTLGAQIMDWFDMSSIVASLSLGSAATGPTFATATAAAPVTDPLAAMALGIVNLAGNGGAGGILNAPLPVLTATPARQQSVVNNAAINAVVRRAMLAQAVGISSQVDATVQTTAHAVRNALCKALDLESLVADDGSYEALQAARRAVWTDMTARASGGARLLDFTPPDVMPALVLAYDRYEDAGRAVELAERNRINHPGFVPARTLQVLSR